MDQLSLAVDFVDGLLADAPRQSEVLGQIDLVFDLGFAVIGEKGKKDIALLDPGQVGGAVDFDLQGRQAARPFAPGDSIGGFFPNDFLVDVQAAEDNQKEEGDKD